MFGRHRACVSGDLIDPTAKSALVGWVERSDTHR